MYEEDRGGNTIQRISKYFVKNFSNGSFKNLTVDK